MNELITKVRSRNVKSILSNVFQDSTLALDDLTDVTITSVADGEVLTWDSATSKWVNQAAGGSGHTIQEEGSSLTARTKLNFVGAGVTATDDAGNDATVVTIPADYWKTDGTSIITAPTTIDNTTGYDLIIGHPTKGRFFSASGLVKMATDFVGLELNDSDVGNATFTDSRVNTTGIEYAADYSVNFTSRSLIDKGYADATYEPALVGEDTRVLFFDGANTPSGDSGLIYNNTTKKLTVGGNLTITSGVLGSTISSLNITGTLSTSAAAQTGSSIQITGAGTAPNIQAAFKISLLAGYTGASSNMGVYAQNQTAGTSTNEFNDVQAANYGEYIATTTGTIVGQSGYASGGNRSYGGMFRSIVAKNSATNIACAGYALNTGTSPIQIGGYFGLQATLPTFASAALMCDNGTQTSDIFVARDNGTSVFKIKNGGNMEWTQPVTTEALTSDTSVTIIINGTTYKLLAKA